jgi:hypothetical protein
MRSPLMLLALALSSAGCGGPPPTSVKRVEGTYSGMGGMGTTAYELVLSDGGVAAVMVSGTAINNGGGVAKNFTVGGMGTWSDPDLKMNWHATSGPSSIFWVFTGRLSSDSAQLVGDNTEQVNGKDGMVERLTFSRK